MSQNRGFTRGFVAIERFLTLMIYSKKIGTKRLCRNSEVVAIQRCRNWEVPLYIDMSNGVHYNLYNGRCELCTITGMIYKDIKNGTVIPPRKENQVLLSTTSFNAETKRSPLMFFSALDGKNLYHVTAKSETDRSTQSYLRKSLLRSLQ